MRQIIQWCFTRQPLVAILLLLLLLLQYAATTVLRPLNQAPQLTSGRFAGAKVYCPHALADGK